MSAGDFNGTERSNGTERETERQPLDLLAEEFVRRHRRGEAPSVGEYARRHPELAEQIRETFPAVLTLERLKPLSADLSSAATSARRELAALKLERLGDYRILREVGRGGMGVVYEAEQESLGRRVALKVLPNHVGMSETTRRRFALEAKAAARLHHTNIVPVFGVGEENGVHYYVMQFIHGQGLDAVLAELRRMRRGQKEAGDEPPPPRVEPTTEPTTTLSASRGPQYWDSVARVGVQVAEALQYAHDAGTLHRDVKPSNLMLDTRGSVWVTDFGLAKLDDQPDLTRDSDVLGTVRYMAPERFAGRCDARSDVYGIGLVLYELLTLRPAYGASDRHRLVQQITQGGAPPRPRSLDPDVPRDLETVVLKASARDPADRYPCAGRLAQDLRRFLEDKPVAARRTGGVERLRRWCRRNPLVAGLTASVAALLLAATVASLVAAARFHGLADRERNARGDAETSRVSAERTLAEIYPLNGFAAASRGNDAEAVMWFSAAARLSEPGTPGEALNRVRAAVWARGAVSPVAAFRTAAAPVTRLAFDRSSRVLTIEDGRSRVAWDLARGGESSVDAVDLSAPPSTSALWTSANADGRLIASGVGDRVNVTDAASSRDVVTITPRRGPTSCGAMSPDGTAVLIVPAAAEHAPALWSIPGGERLPVELEALAGAQALAFSPGGRFVATAHALRDGGSLLRVWALPATALPHARVPLVPRYAAPRFDRATTLVIAGGVGTAHDVLRAVQPFSLETGRPAGPELAPGGVVHCADFSPDGARVVTATRRPDGNSALEFWDRQTGARVAPPLALPAQPMALEHSPSGATLAVLCAGGDVTLVKPADTTGSAPSVVRSWKSEYAPESTQSLIRSGGLRFAPDGRTLVTWGARAAEVWDVETGALRYPPLRHDGRCGDVHFSPDGRYVATAGWDGTARVWEAATGAPAAAPLSHGRDNVVLSARFVPPDGKLLLTSCFDGAVRLWDWQANRLAHPPARDEFYTSGVVTPDGRWVITAAGADAVRVLDCVTGAPVTPPMRVTSVPWTVEVACAPTGQARYAAVGGTGDAIDVFRLDDLYASSQTVDSGRQEAAEIVSGRRLDGGSVVRLAPDEWWDRWQKLAAPAPFDPSSADTLEWHRLRAAEAQARDDAAAAAFHLSRLVDAGAADWSDCQACARQQLALGRWDDAVRCLAEVVRLRPADADLRSAFADALHAVGRADNAASELARAGLDKPIARGNWWVIGPFRYGGRIDESLPPETQDDLTRPVAADDGKSLRWSPLSTTGPWAAFDTTFGTKPNVVGYARQLVHCRGDAPRRVSLSVGSDDLCVLWLNGERIYQYDAAPRLAKPEDARVPVTLRPGWNTLLGKVVNVTGGAKLYVEILPDESAE